MIIKNPTLAIAIEAATWGPTRMVILDATDNATWSAVFNATLNGNRVPIQGTAIRIALDESTTPESR